MNTLERYIGKSILGTIFATLLVLVGLSAIIKFVEQFRSIGRGTYDMLQAIAYTVLTMPKDIETFFPMAALLGALIALGNLASRSELVVMQSAGFSRLKIGLAVMKTALPLVLLTMVIGEWGIPQTEQYARDMRARAVSGGSMMSIKNGIWAKDGNDFIYIQRVTDNTSLQNVYIYHFDDARQLQSVSHANTANYTGEAWSFKQLNVSEISKEKIETKNYLTKEWETSLTPDKLGIVSIRPTSLSISGLSEYIAFLKQTGQDSKKFELTYWRKLFQPISVGVMMMLALSFIFGPLRSVTAGARIVTGICFGFFFYVVNEIFGPLTLVYNVTPLIGALLPSLMFLLITWWLLSRKRD
ncbi:LPS export ABC transporter permease LptG [Actinobacillus porcinus]|uniref:LPS export ABC transporter permease LptG n=1 Tax=Actinobacillus porcinus TaxID=51048 RepID=UPI002A915806|nr:LPS export ABC transporter permease LptG [Actinobacillus porcinus]MDY6215157.1 LPS export ABC transporter permease LptG [Actinobacillus porcinus]